MATTREVTAKKKSRLQREAHAREHGRLMKKGRPCPRCKGPTSARLQEAEGIDEHPACTPLPDDRPPVAP